MSNVDLTAKIPNNVDLGHLHVVEVGPALGVHGDRRAQPDVLLLEVGGPHLLPPLQVVGLPLLERALQALVLPEIDVVGDLRREVYV